MGKRLTENLSSLYIGAANNLKPKHAKRKIVAYVESYDDISFWRALLSEYENDKVYFEVMLPSQSSLAKGKKTVLMNQLGKQLGENMIACVDSDYDYLLQGRTNTSRYMIECPYVLQTAYAIENYHCYAEGLHDVCVTATLNDHKLIDFPAFMKAYSNIAWPLFIWSVWFYRRHILAEFSLLDFCSYVKLDQVSTRYPERSLEHMAKKVEKKLHDLERRHPEAKREIEELKREELPTLGVTSDNTYMFIQGHHIMDNVVLRLLIPVCTVLRREREQQIHDLALHSLQLHNELTNYQRSQIGVEVVIHKNPNYKNSPLYAKIRADVEKLLKRI